MEDRLLILQIAFSMVADSPFYDSLMLDARVEEVKNVYNKLMVLVGDGIDRYAVKPMGMQ
jgi:hypothetical protein